MGIAAERVPADYKTAYMGIAQGNQGEHFVSSKIKVISRGFLHARKSWGNSVHNLSLYRAYHN
jgi:hypothetical protein